MLKYICFLELPRRSSNPTTTSAQETPAFWADGGGGDDHNYWQVSVTDYLSFLTLPHANSMSSLAFTELNLWTSWSEYVTETLRGCLQSLHTCISRVRNLNKALRWLVLQIHYNAICYQNVLH